MSDTHVIAGAGLAGAKAAEALREEGFDGRVVLVGAEPEPPYERPPLSKGYLRGEAPRAQAHVHPDGFYAEHRVERLDPAARTVTLSNGDDVRYDRLLLATGAEPRRLAVPGAELDGVHHLRDLADADRVAAALNAGGRLVVVGGGWIGAEVAASARQRGLDVTLVERGEALLGRVLGPEVGAIYTEIHRDHGVELVTGAAVRALEGSDRVERVVLADGRELGADLVVVGVGVVPRVELAERAGLAVDDGVVTDQHLATSDPRVFAAGDVANAFHPIYGRHIRVEHWANALDQPAVAARSMLGQPAAYERLPYFFSDQYDLSMEYSGHAPRWDEVVVRGDVGAREFTALWVADGRVVARMGVNAELPAAELAPEEAVR